MWPIREGQTESDFYPMGENLLLRRAEAIGHILLSIHRWQWQSLLDWQRICPIKTVKSEEAGKLTPLAAPLSVYVSSVCCTVRLVLSTLPVRKCQAFHPVIYNIVFLNALHTALVHICKQIINKSTKIWLELKFIETFLGRLFIV